VAPMLSADFDMPDGFALAGGADVPGMNLCHVGIVNRAMSPDEIMALTKAMTDNTSFSFSLSKYLASWSIFTKGQRVTRQQVVLCVANKKGGAHWDPGRKDEEISYKALDDLGDHRIGGRYDAAKKTIDKSKSPIFFELLAIGQQVFHSSDIQRLIAEAEKI
jgi:hypothetical protein